LWRHGIKKETDSLVPGIYAEYSLNIRSLLAGMPVMFRLGSMTTTNWSFSWMHSPPGTQPSAVPVSDGGLSKDFHLGTNHELVMWHNSLQHHRGDQGGDRLEFSVTCRSATPVMFRLGFYDHDHHLFLFFPVIFDSSASFSRYPAATDTSTSLQVVTMALVSTTRQGYD